MVNTIELFCGTKSFSKVAKLKGYNTYTVDIDKKFNPDLVSDIMDLDVSKLPKNPLIVWASPPCTEYSRAKSQGIRDISGANKIVLKTIEIIKELKPKYWIIENPQTGLLTKQDFMQDLKFTDASYCMYGLPYKKQTRFWNNILNLKLKTCNKLCGQMIGNRHIGSCGTGGKGQGHKIKYSNRSYDKLEKYAIPPELIKEIIQKIKE